MDNNFNKKTPSIVSVDRYNFWLNLYKPKGISSAKLVAIIKKFFKNEKVGHCGTLDPEAEGVLPLAIGQATKLVRVLVDAKKTYIFTVEFGKKTDTADSRGKIIMVTDILPTKLQCFNICKNFIGPLLQYPPAFSAIKVNGVRSYKLARENLSVELAPRNIEIYKLECLNFNSSSNQATYIVECSKGTYIRSLAEDIALSLQSLGFVVELQRTKVGLFTAEEAIKLIELDSDTRLLPQITIDFLHKSKKLSGFLEKTKLSRAVDKDAAEERRQVLTTKSPTKSPYAGSLIAGEFERHTKCKVLPYLNRAKDWNLGAGHKSSTEAEAEKRVNQDIIKKFLVDNSIKIEAVLDDILVLNVTLEEAQQIIYGQKCYFDYPKNIDLIWLKYNDTLLAIGSVNENCFNSFRVFNL